MGSGEPAAWWGIQEDFPQEAALDLHLSLTEGRIFFLVTNSFVFGIKKEVIFVVDHLESVEERKEENKISCCHHLTNRRKHFGALPPRFLLCFC